MNSYKEIVVELEHCNGERDKLIEFLNAHTRKKEIYFVATNEREIKVFVNKLDVQEFETIIQNAKKNFFDADTMAMAQKIFDAIKNIKSYGLAGRYRQYVDYNKERKVLNREDKVNKRGMFYYAADNTFSKENNDVPNEYLNTILCGDSEELLKNLPDNCIDLVFTSPPYNFGLSYNNHADEMAWDAYFDKLFGIFNECIRVLKYGGRIIVNVQPLFSDYIPVHHILSNYFMKKKMIWKGEILWEKNNYNCKYTAWGSWKSPSNPYLKYTWEFIEIFCKGDLKHEGSSENADILDEEFKKWVYAKWEIAPEFNMKKYGHPAMFPEKLAERVLKLFSFKGDVVLDPFNGVGTTTSVAKELSRKYIGIDISPDYCDIARRRTESKAVNVSLL